MEFKTILHPSIETVKALNELIAEQVRQNLTKVNDAKDSILMQRLHELGMVVTNNHDDFTVKKLQSGAESVVYMAGTCSELVIVTFFPVQHEIETVSFEYK